MSLTKNQVLAKCSFENTYNAGNCVDLINFSKQKGVKNATSKRSLVITQATRM